MSQPEAPLPPRNEFVHKSAIAGAIIAPLAMCLPPRKMDLRFFILAGAFSLSTNQLAYEYTGQSIYARFAGRMGSMVGTDLPEGAQRTRELLRQQRERQAAEQKKQEEQQKGLTKVLNDAWMGGEGKGWREKRAEEHRQKFEEGKGIGDLIMEQVGDVLSGNWRGDKKKDDEKEDESPKK